MDTAGERTVSDARDGWVTEDAVFVVVCQGTSLGEVPLRQTSGKSLVMNGLHVHIVVDLERYWLLRRVNS